MAVESAADVALFFNPDEFGESATITPSGGGAFTTDVLVDRGDGVTGLGGRDFAAPAVVALLPRSSWTGAARGATVVVGGVTYSVDHVGADATGLLWRLDLKRT